MAVFFPLLIISAVALGVGVWAVYGFPVLMGLTYGLSDFCQSLVVRCVEYSAILKVFFLWAGFITLASGIAYGLSRGVFNILRARRAVRRLPLAARGGSVVLIRDKSKAAFTHGLLRPRIYISTGLLNSLDNGEKKAVFLHELHHRRRLDPLRFFLLNLLKDSFFYLPAVRYLAAIEIAKKEHEADDASASSNGPLHLASALVKVASPGGTFGFMPVSIAGVGSLTGRVKRLIDGGVVRFSPPSLKTIAVSVLVALSLSLSLALPLKAAPALMEECSTKHCSIHANRLGEDCKTHCKTDMHTHRDHHHG